MDTTSLIIAISASLMSGLGAAILSAARDHKKEIRRQLDKEQDRLRLELKDLQINLYKLEKDLDEWKDKYYEAIQELIEVKAELEHTLIMLGSLKHN